MPYLNWQSELSESVLSVDLKDSEAYRGHENRIFNLGFEARLLPSFVAGLEELEKLTLQQAEGMSYPELRVDLPKSWVLFVKLREADSRLLIAHPEQGQWVITAALTHDHFKLLLDRVRKSSSGESWNCGSLFKVAKMSNAEITFKIL